MRDDPPGIVIQSRRRDPRTVVGIIYPTGSIYLTNRTGISNVPGNVIHGALTDISSTSQTLQPDEGRATIGTMIFTAVDLNGALTAEIREQLRLFARGIRLREVRVFTGDTDDFNDYVRVETYVVDDVVEWSGRSYRISCSDRNRELRKDLFEQVGTRLDDTLAVDADEVVVQSTNGFELLQHTDAFTDAPGDRVGYIRVRKTGEVIRYTGKTDNAFTGCVRERFGTVAQRIDVDPDTSVDKRPEVEEFIYLEMPGPQLLYAIMTGTVLGTTIELPPSWHLGIQAQHVDFVRFIRIGTDLFDPADHTAGFILRFTHLEKTDGKRFAESQLHIPMGTFAPIDSFGRIALKRMVSLVSSAAPVETLDASNIISHTAVRHVQRKVINEMVFDWNYNGDAYTRADVFLNEQSIVEHGRTKPKDLDFGGLFVSRHSRHVLQRIADTYTDRYGAPPIEFTLELSREMNHLEIGDPVRVRLDRVRDFAGVGNLDRTFEIQSRQINWKTGRLRTGMFGSTARVLPNHGSGVDPVLDDEWYTSEGTPLSSVLTMSGGHVTANGTLTGAEDSRDAVYFQDGDLFIDAGVTVTVTGSLQIRHRGELRIDGTIDGKGNGVPAVTDPNVVGEVEESRPPIFQVAYFGSTRASDGMIVPSAANSARTNLGVRQVGVHSSVPRLALEVEDGELHNQPGDLRGVGGGYGGPIVEGTGVDRIVRARGGGGGAGGAGLALIGRGLSFGASGQIDLSGDDGDAPSGTVAIGGVDLWPGAGGGGSPGSLHVIADGDNVPFPDLTASFVANQGSTFQTGTPMADFFQFEPPVDGMTGHNPGFPVADHFEAAHIVQYVPSDTELGESDDELVPAPLDLAADADASGVVLTWTAPPEERFSYVELWESIDNDLQNSVHIANVRGSSHFRTNESPVTRFFWARSTLVESGGLTARSKFEPLDPNGGVEATFGGGGEVDAATIIFRQAEAPADPSPGNVWYDTDDGRLFRWSSIAWEQIGADDPLLATFNAVAQAGADVTGLNADSIIFYQSDEPTDPQPGWIWVDTDDGAVYQRNAGVWQFIGADDALILGNAPNEAGADQTALHAVNAVDNPEFEAGSVSWSFPGNSSSIVEDEANARRGSWAGKFTNSENLDRILSQSRLQVEPGDRVLAQAFFKRTAGDGSLGMRIDWRSETTFLSTSSGNLVTSSSYAISRVVAVAPAGAVTANADLTVFGGTSTDGFVDGVYLAIIPRDLDIDALGTTNAPNDAGADQTQLHADDIIFEQSAEPSNPLPGWLWRDTDDDNVYRRNAANTIWVFIGSANALNLDDGPVDADADQTSIHADDINFEQASAPSNPQPGWLWRDTDDDNIFRRNDANTAWVFIGTADALNLDNAPAAPGADVTGDNFSQADWGVTQEFTPNWSSGFSTAPSGDLNYLVSEDGRFARLWAPADRLGTSNSAEMTLNNLPAEIRPSGSSNRWATGFGAILSGGEEVPLTARIFDASHASAGVLEFGALQAGAEFEIIRIDNNNLALSGSQGLRKGAMLTWAL